jgi:DNA-binding transcriptional LysR family regulator
MQKRFPKMKNPAVGMDASLLSDQQALMGFDWNDLKYFLAVARHGGLSKAALWLDTSASTVSRHIGALEQRLNMRLFVRLSTGYLLTDAGTELFDRVAEVERSTHAIERRSSVASEGPDTVTGLIRLAATDSFGVHVLAPRLALLKQRHPCLRVEMVLGHAQADLTRREADVALRIMDDELTGAHPDHVMHRVGTVGYSLYAAPPLLAGADVASIDWRRLPYVGWDAGWRQLPIAKWTAEAFAGKAAAMTSNSLTSQMVAVRAGMGVGVLPHFMVNPDSQLLRLPVSLAELDRGLWLAYHRDLRSSLRVQALRAFIDETIPSFLKQEMLSSK